MKNNLLTIIILSLLFIPLNYLNAQFFWNECNTGVNVGLTSVSNINSDYAYACGNNGTVLKTTNAGYNWINVGVNGIPTNVMLVNIFAYNPSLVLTTGYAGTVSYIYRSSNGGNNWTQVFSQEPTFHIYSVWMTSVNNGFMVGTPIYSRWTLRRTTNGGITWDSTGLYLQQIGLEVSYPNSLWCEGSKIWFGTNNLSIYFSSNNGANWLTQPTAPASMVTGLWFDSVTTNIGYAACNTALLKTTNSGINWQQVSNTIGSSGFNSVVSAFNSTNYAWYLRTSSNIYYSWDGGNNWFIQYTAPSGIYAHFSHSRYGYEFGPGVIYAVRNNGGISRCNFFIEGVQIISNEIPETYKLYQNYPNPFNANTKIKFNVSRLRSSPTGEVKGVLVILKVYDITGREISELVNEVIQPGVYSDEWDGTNYPSGIYFYQLNIIDPGYENTGVVEYRESRKMVLIK